jgi:ABC-type multidrug transport system ATPase subunit
VAAAPAGNTAAPSPAGDAVSPSLAGDAAAPPTAAPPKPGAVPQKSRLPAAGAASAGGAAPAPIAIRDAGLGRRGTLMSLVLLAFFYGFFTLRAPPRPSAPCASASASMATPLTVSFRNISVTSDDRKLLLTRASGCFRHGRLTAIMGSSGCGKSTLLTAVVGLTSSNLHVHGAVFENGRAGALPRALVGYVPQKSQLHPFLSVFHTLWSSAESRLPAGSGSACAAGGALEQLGMVPHSDTLNSKLSGGQQRRVNIGRELATSPRLLFLDEPTSALDSVTSLALGEQLREISRTRDMPVVAVIHQPSKRLFEQFDDLFLLTTAAHTAADKRAGWKNKATGRVAYAGPRDRARAYFSSRGGYNTTDKAGGDYEDEYLFMAIAAGEIPPRSLPSCAGDSGRAACQTEAARLWEVECAEAQGAARAGTGDESNFCWPLVEADFAVVEGGAAGSRMPARPASLLNQFYALLVRTMRLASFEVGTLMTTLIMGAVTAHVYVATAGGQKPTLFNTAYLLGNSYSVAAIFVGFSVSQQIFEKELAANAFEWDRQREVSPLLLYGAQLFVGAGMSLVYQLLLLLSFSLVLANLLFQAGRRKKATPPQGAAALFQHVVDNLPVIYDVQSFVAVLYMQALIGAAMQGFTGLAVLRTLDDQNAPTNVGTSAVMLFIVIQMALNATGGERGEISMVRHLTRLLAQLHLFHDVLSGKAPDPLPVGAAESAAGPLSLLGLDFGGPKTPAVELLAQIQGMAKGPLGPRLFQEIQLARQTAAAAAAEPPEAAGGAPPKKASAPGPQAYVKAATLAMTPWELGLKYARTTKGDAATAVEPIHEGDPHPAMDYVRGMEAFALFFVLLPIPAMLPLIFPLAETALLLLFLIAWWSRKFNVKRDYEEELKKDLTVNNAAAKTDQAQYFIKLQLELNKILKMIRLVVNFGATLLGKPPASSPALPAPAARRPTALSALISAVTLCAWLFPVYFAYTAQPPIYPADLWDAKAHHNPFLDTLAIGWCRLALTAVLGGEALLLAYRALGHEGACSEWSSTSLCATSDHVHLLYHAL